MQFRMHVLVTCIGRNGMHHAEHVRDRLTMDSFHVVLENFTTGICPLEVHFTFRFIIVFYIDGIVFLPFSLFGIEAHGMHENPA